ncbi:hypothetical protein BG004_005145 [Podila humilis]|nr:hypothetical protein BG004_005145 [Podila humilis]
MTVLTAPETAQPHMTKPHARVSAPIKDAKDIPVVTIEIATDDDTTPRPANRTIGVPRSSSETLRGHNSAHSPLAFAIKASQFTPAATRSSAATSESSRSSTLTSTKAERERLAMNPLTPTEPKPVRHKFSLNRKKKRLQKQTQEAEEQRLKEEANEALRRKHGEYHPPGHTSGLIHNHRPHQHHDHHFLERSRSQSNMRQQYQQQQQQQPQLQRYPSTSSRVASPISFQSPRSHHTSSAASSVVSSRHNSYTQGYNPPTRPTSPTREHQQRSKNIDLSELDPHLTDLESLDAEGILSENWGSSSEDERNMSFHRAGYEMSSRGGKRPMDTASESSYYTDQSSINPPSALTRPHHQHYHHSSHSTISIDTRPLPTHGNHRPSIPSILQQTRSDSRLSNYRSDSRMSNDRTDSKLSNYPDDDDDDQDDEHVVEMTQVQMPKNVHLQHHHQSWPLDNSNNNNNNNNNLMPGSHDHHNRSVSSLAQYPAPARSRDPLVERYLMNNTGGGGQGFLASTGSPSTTNLHSHQYRNQTHAQYGGGRRSSLEINASEAMRSKAGSRATYRNRAEDGWSVHETELSQEENHKNNNYLAPLPPFQSGPAYTRVPKRKYCKFCFGGCRWWVLLLSILIPLGVMAIVAVFLYHHFQVCKPIDPNTVKPMVYMIDPMTIGGIALEYQTKTTGSIRIIDSPDRYENKVIMRLQRQFHKMESREDLAGFFTETLPNGFERFVLNDSANNQRGFLVPSVLCSSSSLTIELPRTLPGGAEIRIDALIDRQDLTVELDETYNRNTTWRIRTLGSRDITIKSLNINALSISSTSTSPSNILLQSVIVRNQLSVVSVSGNIQAAVGFEGVPGQNSIPDFAFPPVDSPTSTTIRTTPASSSQPTPTGSAERGAMVDLNTLNGDIQFDFKAWNQTSTFMINAPAVQISKAGAIVLEYANSTTDSGRPSPPPPTNGSHKEFNGLVLDMGYNSITGTFKALLEQQNNWSSDETPGGGTLTTMAVTAAPTPTNGSMAKPSNIAGPVLGAGGGSSIPAQLLVQANKKVTIRFP